MDLDSFCGSRFWDWNITWNTNEPKLTPCFEKTVVVWIPCLFLWVSSTVDIYYYCTSQLPKIPVTKLHSAKLVCSITIIILTLIKFFYEFLYLAISLRFAPVDLYSPVIQISTLILAVLLLVGDRINGFYSSGGQFVFWLLLSITESISLRTIINSHYTNDLPFVTKIVISSLICFNFVLHCFSDSSSSSNPSANEDHTRLQGNGDEDGIPNPEIKASFLSKLTFSWAGPIVHLGYKRPLQFSDLWNVQVKDKTGYLCDKLLKYSKFQRKVESTSKAKIPGNKNENKTHGMFSTVIRPLFCAFGWQYALMILLRICADVVWFITPLLLSYLIEFVANENTEYVWKGYFYAILLFLAAMFRSFLLNSHVNLMWLIAYRIRSALNCAIYRKSLTISNFARKETTVGEIVNLMSVDADRVLLFSCWLFQLVASPIQIGIAMYFLYELLGFAIVSGVAIMVLLIPINFFVSRKMQILQRAQMERKDDRVKLMDEILSGMKIIKLYAWEPSFMEQIGKVRDSEISLLKKKAYLQAANAFAWKSAPFLVSLSTFSTYILLSDTNILDAKKAFVSLSLFNLLNEPLYNLASVVSRGVECVVSLKRISNFMNFAEKDNDVVTRHENVSEAIKIENGNFAWDDDKLTLQNINMKIREGSLVAIVGAVGSGKSSILEALLGELRKISGSINIKGKIAYVPQQAWIQNATLENNITFGHPFENSKYENIINCCALRPDLDILPGRDQTEIGEKGINLSGGQKQRVALARAAYFNADVYLLDDPLSAVDSHVGKHIFDNLIGRGGLLNRKTRILVTNAVYYLPYVDYIIVLNDGKISESGMYTDLLEKKGAFSEFLMHYAGKSEETIEDSKESFHLSLAEAEKERLESEAQQNDENANEDPNRGLEDKLIKEEKVQIGNIKPFVIKNYLKSIGWRITTLTLVSFILYQSFAVSCNLWLSESSKGKTENTGNATQDMTERNLFLSVYGILGLFQCVFIFTAVCLLFLGTLEAAKALHNNMLYRIVRAPMSFFDTTPLGRIVNRFSADVQAIDQDLPGTISDFLGCFFQIVAILFVISFSTPVFLGVILAIAPIYIFMQRYFAASSRQLFRLQSRTRSPIFSHFSETLHGVTSIRAYEAQERFLQESETRIDNLQKTLIPLIISRRWLGIRLQTLGNLVILCSALFSVMARKTTSPSIVGLSVSYALQMSQNLLSLMIYGTLLETQIVSAERVIEYTEIEQENDWESKDKRPKSTWPEKGEIKIKNYSTRYRKGMDLVLKDLTCNIEPGEKIGIVGRTGAGKSSVTLGLFRIIESISGSITVDGRDISKLGLHDLRSRLTIIPQDPILFSGTIRFNLDPFSSYSDDQLWLALEHSHLKNFVQQFSAGLDHELLEGGGNLSVGQRQLVCLARAILRKTKILILDEATAAVDLETDDLIQGTIREEFKDCTVITIAHRLNTILDSSRFVHQLSVLFFHF